MAEKSRWFVSTENIAILDPVQKWKLLERILPGSKIDFAFNVDNKSSCLLGTSNDIPSQGLFMVHRWARVCKLKIVF